MANVHFSYKLKSLQLLFLFFVISSSSAQLFGTDLTEFFSNIGHGLRSAVTGDRVTLQGSSGPSSPGYRLVSRDPRDIRYHLFHKRLDPNEYTELYLGDTRDFNSTNFNSDKPVKILIHGFNNNSTGRRFPRDMKNVDWGRISSPAVPRRSQADVFYPVVVDNVPMVGENVGKFILFMLDNGIISTLKQVHVIGFSLGAHVAGFTGQYVERQRRQTLQRITGLDPAGPMYTRVQNDARLDKSDADFVDVIHSSRLGLYEDIGHVDFYPNGGRYQFNCIKLSDYENPFQTFRSFARSLSGAAGSCGHSRAPEYFTYSIRQGPEKLIACKCPSWRDYLSTCKNACEDQITLGEYCPPSARGKYFLEINVPEDYV